jgi:hypothetical protein
VDSLERSSLASEKETPPFASIDKSTIEVDSIGDCVATW